MLAVKDGRVQTVLTVIIIQTPSITTNRDSHFISFQILMNVVRILMVVNTYVPTIMVVITVVVT